jgi:hypothetical protein
MKTGDRLDTLADMLVTLTGGKPHILALLPFEPSDKYSPSIYDTIRTAVEDGERFCCLHAGRIEGSGLDLLTKIQFLIARSELVVAEISDPARPNVFYELGYATALNKQNILLLREGEQAPADLRGLEVIPYSDNVWGLETLKGRLKETLISRLSKENALLRDMLQPKVGRPAYVLCSPSYPAPGSDKDHKLYDERTFGDYLGVVGLLSAFGTFFSEQRDYELISAQYYPPGLLDHAVSLYLIGSPRVNPATGEMLARLQAGLEPKWSLNRAEPSESGARGAIELCRQEDGVTRRYPRIDDPAVTDGRSVHSWDYGLVIRSPHPHPRLRDRLVLIMAGSRSLGTGAACLAATRTALIRKISEKLKPHSIADKRVPFWAVVKGTIKDKYDLLDVDGVEIEDAGLFHPSASGE